jgi:hypothetical protein
MKLLTLSIGLLLSCLSYGQQDNLSLWYTKPAQKWTDALPVGNGRIGGMVFGGIQQERIQLNENDLNEINGLNEIEEINVDTNTRLDTQSDTDVKKTIPESDYSKMTIKQLKEIFYNEDALLKKYGSEIIHQWNFK